MPDADQTMPQTTPPQKPIVGIFFGAVLLLVGIAVPSHSTTPYVLKKTCECPRLSNDPACGRILDKCKELGFVFGGSGMGIGLLNQCFDPVVCGCDPTVGKTGPTLHGRPIAVPVSQADINACGASAEQPQNASTSDRINTAAEVSAQVSILHGGDEELAWAARARLASPDPSARDALHDSYLLLLDDPDLNVKESAILACGELHLSEGVLKIRGIFKSMPDGRSLANNDSHLGNEYRDVVNAAADTLAALGDTESMPELLDRRKFGAMKKFGHIALPYLITQARSSDRSKRRNALEAISRMEDDASTPDLILLLKDSDPKIKDSAVSALVRKKDDKRLSAVEAVYNELDSWGQIDFVSAACGQKGSAYAIPLAKEFIKNSHDADRRAHMVSAVACKGDPATIQFLEDSLKHGDAKTRDEAACQLTGFTHKAYPHSRFRINWCGFKMF